MGVISQLREYPKTFWNRAVYVARTEGFSAMVRQTAQFAGVAREQPIVWEDLPREPIAGATASAAWPDSVLLVAAQDAGDLAERLAALGIPVLRRTPSDVGLAAAQQLVSVVVVAGSTNLFDGVARTAQRLGQRLLLILEPGDDAVGATARGDAFVVASARDLRGEELRAALLGEVG